VFESDVEITNLSITTLQACTVKYEMNCVTCSAVGAGGVTVSPSKFLGVKFGQIWVKFGRIWKNFDLG